VGPQPSVVAMSSSARVGVGEGFVACSSGSLSTSGGLGRYRAAQWHLARAVGKRLYVHTAICRFRFHGLYAVLSRLEGRRRAPQKASRL